MDADFVKMSDTGVAVWHYTSQRFVEFYPCPGEKRVRLDVFDDLSNYAVYSVEYTSEYMFNIKSMDPLTDWVIDLS